MESYAPQKALIISKLQRLYTISYTVFRVVYIFFYYPLLYQTWLEPGVKPGTSHEISTAYVSFSEHFSSLLRGNLHLPYK